MAYPMEITLAAGMLGPGNRFHTVRRARSSGRFCGCYDDRKLTLIMAHSQVLVECRYSKPALFLSSLGPFGPIPIQPSHGFVLSHRRDRRLVESDSTDEQVDKLGGKRFRRHLGFAPVGLDSVLHTAPELGIRYDKLVTQDVAPDTRPVRGPIDGMRNPSPKDSAISQAELIGDVVSSRTPTGISHLSPVLYLAELLMKLPGGLRPCHRPVPTSHSRN